MEEILPDRVYCVFVSTYFCGIPVFAEEKEDHAALFSVGNSLWMETAAAFFMEKNEKQIRPMASTTKIMTCILALEQGNMEDVVTVSSYAASQPKVHMGSEKGRAVSA